jgi:DNA-binding transcriptional ArsR family regulator
MQTVRRNWRVASAGAIVCSILRQLAKSLYKIDKALRALANERRLQILGWLKDPTDHFPPQVDGDLVKDGVCGLSIAQKLGVSQPTASEHLNILLRANLLRGKRVKQWTFYKRHEAGIKELKKSISTVL